MTRPGPFDNSAESYEDRRRNWLDRYLYVQARTDMRVRTVLLQGAEDAKNRLILLENNTTFSAGVRAAQIRLAMDVVRRVHESIFGQLIPIIKDGQTNEAATAVDSFAATDERYLQAALGTTGAVDAFVAGQRKSAELGVAHAISRITRSERPLSERVYRSRSIANKWVERIVTSAIMRGDSAADIAKAVRSHILPSTPGGTAYAAMRLGRTELNNAFHATSVELAKDRPWVEAMRWNLSSVHEIEDPNNQEICEKYAAIGVFEVDQVPAKPHPQCRCYSTPELEPFETFVTNLTAGYYRGWTSRYAA